MGGAELTRPGDRESAAHHASSVEAGGGRSHTSRRELCEGPQPGQPSTGGLGRLRAPGGPRLAAFRRHVANLKCGEERAEQPSVLAIDSGCEEPGGRSPGPPDRPSDGGGDPPPEGPSSSPQQRIIENLYRFQIGEHTYGEWVEILAGFMERQEEFPSHTAAVQFMQAMLKGLPVEHEEELGMGEYLEESVGEDGDFFASSRDTSHPVIEAQAEAFDEADFAFKKVPAWGDPEAQAAGLRRRLFMQFPRAEAGPLEEFATTATLADRINAVLRALLASRAAIEMTSHLQGGRTLRVHRQAHYLWQEAAAACWHDLMTQNANGGEEMAEAESDTDDVIARLLTQLRSMEGSDEEQIKALLSQGLGQVLSQARGGSEEQKRPAVFRDLWKAIQEEGADGDKAQVAGRTSKAMARTIMNGVLALILQDPNETTDGKRLSLTGEPRYAPVQEDLITDDLMILAREAGIWKEYEAVFQALRAVRLVQVHLNMSVAPGRINCPPKLIRWSLFEICQRFAEAHGKKPKIGSFGSGKEAILERMVLEAGLAETVVAVDVNRDSTEKTESDLDQTGLTATLVPEMEQVASRRQRRDPNHLYRDALNALTCEEGQFDILIALDALHETSNPFAVFRRLFMNKLKRGGALVVHDPSRTELFDPTRHVEMGELSEHLKSILSMEEHATIIAYLTLWGAKIHFIKGIPSTVAGKGDSIFRYIAVIEKGTVPFAIPEDTDCVWEEKLEDEKNLFKVWPLSLITDEEKRGRLIDFINTERTHGHAAGVPRVGDWDYAKVKGRVIEMLLDYAHPSEYAEFGMAFFKLHQEAETGGDLGKLGIPRANGVLSRDIKHSLCEQMGPHSDYLYGSEGLFEALKKPAMVYESDEFEDPALIQKDYLAGEVRLMVLLLREVLGIDIECKVNKTNGWKQSPPLVWKPEMSQLLQ